MSIWRWADRLDPIPEACRITLGEGTTPLVPSRRIGPSVGLRDLWFKLESVMPTGSYKDRFAAAAVSHMVAAKQSVCIATSSGNTGASLAAYCCRANIECRIALVEGAPEGKLQQMLAHGAKLVRIRGFGADPTITANTMHVIRQLGARPGWALQVSAFAFSPLGMAGVKTISYELAEQCGDRLDHVFVPAGGGGLSLAVTRGFADLRKRVRVEIVQPAGNNTIAGPLREGVDVAKEVACTSAISGLQVPNVIDGTETLRACRSSGGTGHVVEDDAIWDAQRRLSREEGIFCEPAAATALAGLLQAVNRGEIDPNARIVCLITGIGFKDPASIPRLIQDATCPMMTLEEFTRLP